MTSTRLAPAITLAAGGTTWLFRRPSGTLNAYQAEPYHHPSCAWMGTVALLGYRSCVPQPRHTKADLAALEQFKKPLPAAAVELWSEDEHRIGLKPIIRWIWRKKGQRSIVSVQHRYKWTYLYGLVCPQSGQTFWLLLPPVAASVWSNLLAECAAGGLGRTSGSCW